MKKSHAVARTSVKPTFAQLKELMGQIDTGRITKESLQRFLRDNLPEPVIEPDSLLDLFTKQFVRWQEQWPGKEVEMASRLFRFLPGSPSLSLRDSAPEKWTAFRQAIYWQTCNELVFVKKKDMCVDYPTVRIETSFDDSLFALLNSGIESRLSKKRPGNSWSIYQDMMLVVVLEKGGDKYCYPWVTGGMLDTRYEWGHPLSLLEDCLGYTLRVVASLLTLDEHVEEAYTLLDMWGSGNFPLGFDENNNLIVLTA